MNKQGPIIIIDDDDDDQVILTKIFKTLNYKNQIVFFSEPEEALTFLTTTDVEPFIVLSDIYMHKLNGLELREQVYTNKDLRVKCIPYLFFTISDEKEHIVNAYSTSVQGFFVKPSSLDKFEQMIRRIVEYWQDCVFPSYI